MLNFKSVELSDKSKIEKYLFKYGENSCQHSFAAMYCNKIKYNDSFCEKENFLYILRANKCSEEYRVYLFPMGDRENKQELKKAIQNIIDDAHNYNKKVCFSTLTKSAKDLVQEFFPNEFICEDDRGYYEYIYSYEKLANLATPALASKRQNLNRFYRTYSGRVKECLIRKEEINNILKFQEEWLLKKTKGINDVQLEQENEAIKVGLSKYDEIGFSGIVVYVDDNIVGYAYGIGISDTTYDVFIEKGDRKYDDIYKVLNRDLVRMCCQKYKYINREEDVGVEGLRIAKMSYKPDIMLEKYILREPL